MNYLLCGLVLFLFMVSSMGFMPSSRISKTWLQMVSVGEVPPDFELKNYQGKAFKLSSFKGKKPVVVFFYPADNTPGCTTEACAFQRLSPDFKKFGAEVFGVSSNGAADKEKFISGNKLTSIELLIDEGSKVRTAWNVPKALFGALPGRVTYVISKEGKVVTVFDDLGKAALHPEKALEALGASK
eukprot:gene29785-35964_t